jgi:prepilin signal peptidase PulO-like enzyme (type II secretory pathway)
MYLPIIFILLAFPSVNVGILQRSYMLCLCLFLGLAMTTGALFLIDWWLLEISIGSTIPIEILGMIFAGIMLGLHLNTHVTKVPNAR